MRVKKQKKGDAPASAHDDTIRLVSGLADIAEDRQLTEIVVDTEGLTVTIRRGAPPVAAAPPAYPLPAQPAMVPHPPVHVPAPPPMPSPAAEAAAEAGNGHHHLVTSPFVGTFYRRPNPDADPYVELGVRVDKGQVLCIVEAMKLMNEIEADVAGIVVSVLVDDAQPVEYGQPLFKIDPA
jgi:acetyl-CoA carboxylase biotin carboxyl carrier protein